MKLKKLVVTGFRSIKGTEKIRVDDKVSILIGANDHGKSNILRAIECLNEDCPFEEDDVNWDLPKEKTVKVEWHFVLSDGYDLLSEINSLRTQMVPEEEVTDENAEDETIIPLSDANQVELNRIVTLPLESLTDEDKNFLYTHSNHLTPEQAKNFQTILESDNEEHEETPAKVEEKSELDYIQKNEKPEIVYYREGVNSPVKVLSVPLKNIPVEDEKYILELRPRVELFETIHNNLKDKVSKKDIDKPDCEFMQGIFILADIWKDKDSIFIRNLVTERTLDDASKRLTEALNKDWNQGRELEWMLQHNGTSVEIMIKDPAIGTRYTRPSTRSSGFKTYFVTSMVIKARTTKNPSHSHIYLFDEPGIYLHPKAQLDLQRALELISDGVQVVYTTHSLFLINKNYPKRNKVVSKTAKGTKINQKPYLNNWKSIRESLGILLSNNFLIADKTIVTEGPSDLIYLWGVIRGLKGQSKVDIDLNDLSIVDAGESQNYVAITKVMLSEGRGILALVDGDSGGDKIKSELEKVCAKEIKEKKLQIKQLDKNKSIEDYSVNTETFKKAIKLVVNNLVNDAVRELNDANALEKALKKVKKQAGKTLGKVVMDELGGGNVFIEPKDNVSKLSIALQYEDLNEGKTTTYDNSVVDLVKNIQKSLSLRGEKSAEKGVFSEIE